MIATKTLSTTRRGFLNVLGAGIVIAVAPETARAQVAPAGGRGRGGGGRGGAGGAKTVAARLHIGQDGIITVMTGKVECGQGARAELTQAAAEELRVGADRVRLVMADTGLAPDDGGTSGSQSTPSTVPAIRRGCSAARGLLVALAARRWEVDAKTLEVRDGKVSDGAAGARSLSYADLAADKDAEKLLAGAIPADVVMTPVESWKVMGTSVARPNGRDIVMGAHHYPSDVSRPGMLYGRVLRAPAYNAKLASVDLGPAKGMTGVVAVQDKDFVGVAATTAFLAERALEAIAKTAKWEDPPAQPSSEALYDYLRERVRGGAPKNPFADEVAKAAKSLRQSYHVAYVQHCPMEPRAAVAEWIDDKLTVWTGTQQPFGVRGALAQALGVAGDRVRVIVPDVGGGFGGKPTGECAVEAARLARGAGKPVSLRWTREEEFTWAYFRPAGVIEAEASLDDRGGLATWNFTNINSGGNEVQSPYRVAKNQARFVGSEPPLRHGSYRALAVTANTFGRESFMDELAVLAGRDPLEFRLAHLEGGRLRTVLEEAARRFDWASRVKDKRADVGVGLACGTDKGSYVAACAEVVADRKAGTFTVTRVCQAYECGKIINPANLMRQVTGAIVMGLGPALREEMRFAGGKILNGNFADYEVPRFADLPELEVHLLDRADLASAGAGETPIIAIAPAVANALFAATGVRVRQMPIRLGKAKAN
ncbi:MAG: nicB [Phycisphaerales bacterium]|nr:nicB [Phycisphaerales bacterium]